MSTPPTQPPPGPGRDTLPPKKRDPRLGFPGEPAEEDIFIFKVPFPYKSQNDDRSYHVSHPDLHRPIHVPAPKLYQPWTQSSHTTTTRAKPYLPSSPVMDLHGCAEWAELYHRGWAAIHSAWDVPLIPNHHHHRDVNPPSPHTAVHPTEDTHPHHPSKFRPVILTTENSSYVIGGEHRWQTATVKAPFGPHTRRQGGGRHRAPYTRGRQGDQQSRSATVALSTGTVSSSANKNHHHQRDLAYTHHNIAAAKYPTTTEKYWTLEVRESTGGSPPHRSNSVPSDQHPPWLLPHFAAGSLIELRDGRLRRVEDLQMEDFLVGAEACPELHLSCCTVQHISPSASPSLSRLLILLHNKCSQESLDVFVEYPFFVRGRGWSSCCPQRTARLCGLRCHQLSVGDVCLALTPSMPPSIPPPVQGPSPSPTRSDDRGLQVLVMPSCPQPPLLPPAPDRPAERQGGGGQGGGQQDPTRRRRWSAPDLSTRTRH